MIRIQFNEDWYVKKESASRKIVLEEKKITLPHDAMIETERRCNAPYGTKKAFFENGVWEYRKGFEMPEEWKGKHVFLEFEGVYMQAMIYVNGCFAGKHMYGYTEFTIEISKLLREDGCNEIKVITRTGDDSRWYSGAGIYRNVNILVAGEVHVKNNGVFLTTQNLTKERARVQIETEIMCEGSISTIVVEQIIRNSNGVEIMKNTVPATICDEGKVIQYIEIETPQIWDMEHPNLYTCTTRIYDKEAIIDEVENRFGIRKITLDMQNGFMLNDTSVKLRGSCIHHDNGVIGARTFYSAEYRRVKKLKEAGFNAIRMSHHPASRGLLEACDELGMLVMDETFDMWRKNKSSQDYALYFDENWEEDVESMVRKDRNHPSVVIYSIGNEIPDLENASDTETGRQIVEKIRELDATRYTTNAINGILLIMNKLSEIMAAMGVGEQQSGGEINETMSSMGEKMAAALNMPFMDKAIEEGCSQVDIAGYNYMADRYETDLTKYPERIIVGSETYPRDICRNWRRVEALPNVIGDFTWTGWDYLGETGIGKVVYGEKINALEGFYGDYPYITARCGDIDITGYRLPISYYREIIFGLRKQPYLAVQRPERAGQTMDVSVWGWNDVISSWSFPGYEGTEIFAEVYSDAEEVEILVNGNSVGRKTITKEDECKVSFPVTYVPGLIEVVAYQGGMETGRYQLKSSGENVHLRMTTEKEGAVFDGQDLIFVNLLFEDDNEICLPYENHEITLDVSGAGELIGFGNGAYMTEESYSDQVHSTFDGRAFAVIMPNNAGIVTIQASANGFETTKLEIMVSN